MTPSSPEPFDAYLQWLGIPPHEQPADHYRLLGLSPFEADPERIEAAADERMNCVRRHQTGPRGILTQPLLNELAAARNCLMSADSKGAYDAQLRMATPVARVIPQSSGDKSEVPQSPESEELTRATSLGSLAITSLGMAAAVVLVAGGTFSIGRWLLMQPQVVQPPQDVTDHRVEVNPEEFDPSDAPLKRPAPKPPAEVNAVVVMQEGSRDVNLLPATAVLSGGVELQPGGEERLEGWSKPNDSAAWAFKLLRPGFFQLEITYALTDEAGEISLAMVRDGGESTAYSLRPTGAKDRWRTHQRIVALKTNGRHTLDLRLKEGIPPGSFAVKQVRLTPVTSQADEPK